jgi:creatinine amidohydrolase
LRQILAEDGLTRLSLLGPRSYANIPLLEWSFGSQLPAPQVQAVVPVGHTEQHGFHLPLNTDTAIVRGIARQVGSLMADLQILPSWPYGVSSHRTQYPGTLSLDPRIFEDFWVEVCGALGQMGSQVVYLLNGHGGNHSFLVNVCKFAGERFPGTVSATTFLHTSSGRALQQLEELRQSSFMGHACELETSYMLHLHPELVHLEWAVDEEQFLNSSNYRMDWVETGALILNPPWSDDTQTGTYGRPSCASAEKGKIWLDAAAQEVVLHLQELGEQWASRRARRQQGWVEGAWRQHWLRRPKV